MFSAAHWLTGDHPDLYIKRQTYAACALAIGCVQRALWEQITAALAAAGVDASASRLLSGARIQGRVRELQEAISARTVERTSITKAWIVAKLVENVERAMQIK